VTTSTAPKILTSHFFRHLSATLLLLTAMLAFSSHAKEAAGMPPHTDASYAILADLLENDQSRKKLIEQLRALALQDEPKPASAAATARSEPRSSVDASNGIGTAPTANAPVSQKLAVSLERFTNGLAYGNLRRNCRCALTLRA